MANETIIHEYGNETANGIISKITIPTEVNGVQTEVTYEIHDAKAIHNAEDLGLSAALRYMGKVATEEALGELSTDTLKSGDVYIVETSKVGKTNVEFVCIVETSEGGTETIRWEELGPAHDFVGTDDFDDHTHSFTQPTVTIPSLTASGDVPAYIANTTHLSATSTTPTISPGNTYKEFLKGSATTEIGALTSVSGTPGEQSAGSAAVFKAEVNSGVLKFTWIPNTPATVQSQVITAVSGNTENITVSFDNDQKDSLPDAWTASTPSITISSGTTGNVEVATGVAISGTSQVSLTTQENVAASVSGGAVGKPA